jgi:hypothetical protein
MVTGNGTRSKSYQALFGGEKHPPQEKRREHRRTNGSDSERSRKRVETIETTEKTEPQAQTKRGRGRPRKTEAETVSVSEERIKIPKEKKQPSLKGKFIDDDKAHEMTTNFLMMVEMFAVNMLGEQAAFNLVERTVLQASFAKMIASMEISTIDRASKILYPAGIIAGTSMYGLRLASLYNEKQQAERIDFIQRHQGGTVREVPDDELNADQYTPEHQNGSTPAENAANFWDNPRTIDFTNVVRK